MTFDIDMGDIRGQDRARRSLEIAAVGNHNILVTGVAGCGKMMLARRLTTILPVMEFEEHKEVVDTYSEARMRSVSTERPFRAPHHTVSEIGIFGNKSHRHGELSLARHGVLMLDDLPEFQHHILERLNTTLKEATNVLLVGVMSPCPCGNDGKSGNFCHCPVTAKEHYKSQIDVIKSSFEMHVEVPTVPSTRLLSVPYGEKSSVIRDRVVAARARVDTIKMSEDGYQISEMHVKEHKLSHDEYDKLVQVSISVAALDGSETVTGVHVSEATVYVSGREIF